MERAFAKVAELKEFDVITCDGRFDCGIANKTVEVKQNVDGLFVGCECGQHYLAGNVGDDGETYLGYYHATEAEKKNISTVEEIKMSLREAANKRHKVRR